MQSNKRKMLKACAESSYKFTGSVKKAYLRFAKSRALYDLATEKKKLPQKFLEWVDSDPVVRDTVYGMHFKASDILQHLYALRLDLGKERFTKYLQLVLAEAVDNAKKGREADIKPRKPIRKIEIPGDPRVKVNTRSSKRKLDMNDHIINFLETTTITAPVRKQRRLAELKYDDRGIAIPEPKSKSKEAGKMEKRTLFACDVIASRALQKKFNAFMKSKGHNVNIDCGDNVLHWNSRDMLRGEIAGKISKAYKMFKTAYEEKGRLPKQRDPGPAPGEDLAYIIRNYEYKFPKGAKRKWEPFPITAPWPTQLMLAGYNQPLREREERWVAFRDRNEFVGYGEYIGKIAQQFVFQSARRLTPYPFQYGTMQMMLKDGGVCGTMANMGVRSMHTVGTPATTAGQPGHCALISMKYDKKSNTYSCRGGQYATGGDDKTTPHFGWMFGNTQGVDGKLAKYPRKNMVYHQSIAWAVNYGLPEFLNSMVAHAVFELLPAEAKKAHGMKLLKTGLAVNPYNAALTDSAIASAASPLDLINFWKSFNANMTRVGDKPGCPKESLYNRTVKNNMFNRMLKMPVPEDKRKANYVLKFIQSEKCENKELVSLYFQQLKGLSTLLASTAKEFKAHLKNASVSSSDQIKKESAAMNELITATAKMIKSEQTKKEWANSMWKLVSGNEKYFDRKNNVLTEDVVPTLAKLTGQTPPSDEEMLEALQRKLYVQLKKSVAGKQRTLSGCKMLAGKLKATAALVENEAVRKRWLKSLAKVMKNREEFNEKGQIKTTVDPCAGVIEKLLTSNSSK